MINNEKLFITGGTGFLGKCLVKRYYEHNEIVVYSRREHDQYFLKKQYPKIQTIVGDIRNLDLMRRSSEGCSVGLFLASMKQIEAVDENVEEAVEIIVKGALNSRRIAEENSFKSACFISSDKSRSPTTIYGSLKHVSGEAFIVHSEKSNVALSTAIYGNVWLSTGSLIPLIWESIKKNYPLTLYSEEMTRFMIHEEEAVDLIEYALRYTGVNIIPNLKSFKVKDLFEIYKEKFNLRYTIGKPRVSEKLHEMLYSKEESNRVTWDRTNNYFQMHYKNISNNILPFNELTSDKVVMTKEELNSMLEKYDYFK